MIFKNFTMKSLPWKCLLFLLRVQIFPLNFSGIQMCSRGYMWRYFVCEGERQLIGVMGWAAPADVGGSEMSHFCSLWEEQPFRVLAIPHWVCQLAGSDRMKTPQVALKQLFWLQGVVWLWQFRAQSKQLIYLAAQLRCIDDIVEHTHCLQRSRIHVSLFLCRTRIWPLLCKTVTFVVVSCELVFLYHVWATK